MALDDVAGLLASTPIRWWFTGGIALELHAGRSWRSHDDIDVGLCRGELALLAPLLDDWEIHVAAAGELRPWRGEHLLGDRHENNLWLRRPGGAWCLDVAIGEGDEDHWTYRRDRSLRLAWDRTLRISPGDHRYLDPALQLLFKSEGLRPKDDVDAVEVVPELDDWGIALLDVRLGRDHPWRPLIERHRRPLPGSEVLDVLDLLAGGRVDVWVDGGWGVDALLGTQTRLHADLDLALPTRQWSRALDALDRAGFVPVRDSGPHNVVVLDDRGRLVDLHSFDDTTTVIGDDGIERHGPDGLAYEAGGFDGVGSIDGRIVACMSASFQMRSHTGYDVDADDWHDVRLLHERFGLPIPPDYARIAPAP
jgi:lincosamide nucleotidyltransferase A/C/D/E